MQIQKSKKFKDYHIEQLRDPEDARIYLSVALSDYENDEDIDAFLLAVRDVAEAQGDISKLPEGLSLSDEALHKSLSTNGNPQLNTIRRILHELGFELSIEVRENRLQANL